MNDARLLKFLMDWRGRITKKRVEHLSDEEFGQLATLNTVIYFIQTESEEKTAR